MKLLDLFGEDESLVKDAVPAPLGWGPSTLVGKCPHCSASVRAYYNQNTCWKCGGTLKWKAPKGYRLNKK